MELIIKENEIEIAELLSDKIIELLKKDVLITMASGDTVLKTYNEVVRKYNLLPFEIRATLVNLDEWVGLDREDVGSCQYNMFKDLFDPLKIKKDQLIYFDAKAKDLDKECKRVDSLIGDRKFEFVLLGVGMNGHLALNEPGCLLDTKSFYTSLDETTKIVMNKYFPHKVNITQGISLGIKYFMESKELYVVAMNAKKHDIIHKVLDSNVTNMVPATIVKEHNNSKLIIDNECYKGE